MRRIFDGIALAELLGMFFLLALNWRSLPEQVPVHFGMSGAPDRWSDPGSLLLLPCVGVFVFGVMTVVSMFPGSWNLPANLNEENRSRVFAIGAEMLACVKAQSMSLLFWINWRTIAVARGDAAGIGPIALVIVPAIGVTMANYPIRINRALNRPANTAIIDE